jgi:two-component system, NtrC family, sensor kinase
VLSRKRIRSQMYYGVFMLLCIVLALSAAGTHGALQFRKATKDIRFRSQELPLVAQLSREVSDLRVTFTQIRHHQDLPHGVFGESLDLTHWEREFCYGLNRVAQALDDYEHRLETVSREVSSDFSDSSKERENVCRMRDMILFLEHQARGDWVVDRARLEDVEDKLIQFQQLAGDLPGFMKLRMETFAEMSRSEYHTWLTLLTIMTSLAAILLLALIRRFRKRIFDPLEILLQGSRRVASGDYQFRIRTGTDDEVAELADAMNAMTANFQDIKLDLNRQVQQRTQEVIRSEKMASVGFLAAGVAHEINNPLASIAWSAESLEMRLHEILEPAADISPGDKDREIEEMRKYLRRIQDEAFRCKGITSSLLDFSRMGEARKASSDLVPLVEGVMEIIKPLSRYRGKPVRLIMPDSLHAVVNEQEIKQVVLNLVTNALDAIDSSGEVTVELAVAGTMARIVVTDSGCGMTPEVLSNIFEPFFTRKREGQGTGLGLSITYRIVEEHHGTITAYSAGSGRGSRFTVTLPLAHHEQKILQAA